MLFVLWPFTIRTQCQNSFSFGKIVLVRDCLIAVLEDALQKVVSLTRLTSIPTESEVEEQPEPGWTTFTLCDFRSHLSPILFPEGSSVRVDCLNAAIANWKIDSRIMINVLLQLDDWEDHNHATDLYANRFNLDYSNPTEPILSLISVSHRISLFSDVRDVETMSRSGRFLVNCDQFPLNGLRSGSLALLHKSHARLGVMPSANDFQSFLARTEGGTHGIEYFSGALYAVEGSRLVIEYYD